MLDEIRLAIAERLAFSQCRLTPIQRGLYVYRSVPFTASVAKFKGYQKGNKSLLEFNETSWLDRTTRSGGIRLSTATLAQAIAHLRAMTERFGRAGRISYMVPDPVYFECFMRDSSTGWHYALVAYGIQADRQLDLFAADSVDYFKKLVDRERGSA